MFYLKLRNYCVIVVLILMSGATLAAEDKSFNQEELDQLLAPIALYPDSLLSQILMAATYPADVAAAVTWSKNNADVKGDDAVTKVQGQSWDPAVMSLVAFPQVLEMMGQQPDWVRNLGDAFLAKPDAVMDTAQSLRKRAQDEGNLKTTKEQVVTVETPTPSQTTIIIEPANPQVIYVPVYNPTVVYGTWWWPAYRPYYYYPVGYGIARGIGFGIGIGITHALWGGVHWGNRSVNINVNRYNNININNNRISGKGKNSDWKHNAKNRKGVPYKDKATRAKFDRSVSGADRRQNFRGRDADRSKAQSALKDRGLDPVQQRRSLQGSGGKQARDTVNKVNRDRPVTRNADRSRDRAAAPKRDVSRQRSNAPQRSNTPQRSNSRSRSTALSGAGRGDRSRQSASRGRSSVGSRSVRGGGRGR